MVYLHRDEDGKWYWKLVSGTHVLFTSKKYSSESAAVNNINLVRFTLHKAEPWGIQYTKSTGYEGGARDFKEW